MNTCEIVRKCDGDGVGDGVGTDVGNSVGDCVGDAVGDLSRMYARVCGECTRPGLHKGAHECVRASLSCVQSLVLCRSA